VEKKEVTTMLVNLRSMTYENRHTEIEHYSVETLESLAVELYENDIARKTHAYDRWMVWDILMKRAHKLNRNFTWTSENIDRLLKINDKLTEVFEKAYKEAKSVVSGLEKRIQDNDPFLKDYEVEIELTPYMHDPDDETEDEFALVLSEPIGNSAISHHFSHCDSRNQHDEIPLYIDKKLNWNIEYFDETVNDYYIGYAIHALLDNHWSFPDILRIKTIWGDVKIDHQHFICRI
jgi:hypothetical protein